MALNSEELSCLIDSARLVLGVDGDERSLNLNTLKNRFGEKGFVHLKRDARHSYLSDGEKSVR